ncbi:MAG TPA: glycosyltransferase [Bacteroidales bacterium]|nr:glycosyltransferase [Bacteroidales bacterium]
MILLPVILTLPYFLVLLWIYFRLSKARKFSFPFEKDLCVSVVVACRNEEKNLPALLTSLSDQEYPQHLVEIIIVDDHSTDSTGRIAETYSAKLNIRLFPNKGKGKKEAIRTGVLNSGSDLIITTDADCIPGKRWISSIVSKYESEKADLIAGPVRLTGSAGFLGKFQQLEFLSLQSITAGTILSGSGTMCNGANLAFTRDAWLRSEKDLRFDILTGDDVFLLHSLKKQKALITWAESQDAIVDTKAAPDLRSFLRQRKRWASKSTAYKDPLSIFLGIVTFVTNMVFAVMIVSVIIDPDYLRTLAAVFILKSIPDFLLLHNTASRYKRRNLLWWFLPSQIVYPFYVLTVSIFALIPARTHP